MNYQTNTNNIDLSIYLGSGSFGENDLQKTPALHAQASSAGSRHTTVRFIDMINIIKKSVESVSCHLASEQHSLTHGEKRYAGIYLIQRDSQEDAGYIPAIIVQYSHDMSTSFKCSCAVYDSESNNIIMGNETHVKKSETDIDQQMSDIIKTAINSAIDFMSQCQAKMLAMSKFHVKKHRAHSLIIDGATMEIVSSKDIVRAALLVSEKIHNSFEPHGDDEEIISLKDLLSCMIHASKPQKKDHNGCMSFLYKRCHEMLNFVVDVEADILSEEV